MLQLYCKLIGYVLQKHARIDYQRETQRDEGGAQAAAVRDTTGEAPYGHEEVEILGSPVRPARMAACILEVPQFIS